MKNRLNKIPDFVEFALHLAHPETISNRTCMQACEWIKRHHGREPSELSTNSIEKRLGGWLRRQRKSKAGKGSSKFYESNLAILQKYGLNNLFETVDLEEKSNATCIECLEWKDKNNRDPSAHAKDDLEKKLGTWLSKQRQAKKGSVSNKFYKSNQKLATLAGYPDLFKTPSNEEESNHLCLQCIFWKKENNGKEPNSNSKNPTEKKLGKWLINQRQAKKGNRKRKFYQSNQELAERHNFPNLFDIV